MSGWLKFIAIGVTIFVCAIVPANVIADDSTDPFNGVFYTGFDKEGKFVLIPTRTGSYIGLVVGAIPAALVSGGFHLFGAQSDLSMDAGRKTLKCVCYPCGFALGAPFLLMKYLVWDAPLYMAAGLMDGNPPPPAPVNGSTQ